MKGRLNPPASPAAWLWWAALLILLAGGAIAYLLYTFPPDPESTAPARFALAVTAVFSGVCLISATANWWLHR